METELELSPPPPVEYPDMVPLSPDMVPFMLPEGIAPVGNAPLAVPELPPKPDATIDVRIEEIADEVALAEAEASEEADVPTTDATVDFAEEMDEPTAEATADAEELEDLPEVVVPTEGLAADVDDDA